MEQVWVYGRLWFYPNNKWGKLTESELLGSSNAKIRMAINIYISF